MDNIGNDAARRLKAYENQVGVWLRSVKREPGKFVTCEPCPLPPDDYVELLTRAGRVTSAGGLQWMGDSVGRSATEPATIDLVNAALELITVSVKEALAKFDRINVCGRARIITGLRHAAENGTLHPDDLEAFRDWEANHG
ncbi:hypothetical protein [Cupriavidus plantarum]|uniref:hypothetical protein n=1 Tax=Cupriavidus plantarum TaxID=942865 RepID=UPI000F182CEA|nr:hypothetical protein [Cupriavidus plantarum]RLK36114.1 hypothetical protein C7417_3890 [Cupriavidus plantarum]